MMKAGAATVIRARSTREVDNMMTGATTTMLTARKPRNNGTSTMASPL